MMMGAQKKNYHINSRPSTPYWYDTEKRADTISFFGFAEPLQSTNASRNNN